MPRSTSYDFVSVPFPTLGMNVNTDADVLDSRYAQDLENIIPTPMGAGTLRYGTETTATLLPDDTIAVLEAWPYAKDNDLQTVFYSTVWVWDQGAVTELSEDGKTLTVTPGNAALYQKNSPLRIEYKMPNDNTVFVWKDALSKAIDEDGDVVPLNAHPIPPTAEIQRLYLAQGRLSYDNGQTVTTLKDGLSGVCIPYGELFINKLVLCNGFDRVMVWDGTTLADVAEWVKESGAKTFARVSDTVFTTVVDLTRFKLLKYPVDGKIALKMNNVLTPLILAQQPTLNNETLTVTVQGVLPPFQGTPELFYQDYPPRFSFIKALHERLWGLGEGLAGTTPKAASQALTVSYAVGTNSLTHWFNEQTRTVPKLNLSKTHGLADDLLAIAGLGRYTLFFGRNRTQVWIGKDPPINENPYDFRWVETRGVGLTHGKLLLTLPNDLWFVSPQGILSANTLNQSNQLAMDATADAMNPLVKDFLNVLLTHDTEYLKARSWLYRRGQMAGFKIGQQKILAARINVALTSWFLLSGDFFDAATVWDAPDARLYLAIGRTIYRYADSPEGALYADQGGTVPIPFRWGVPRFNMQNRRIALKRYELGFRYPVDFALDPQKNHISLTVTGDGFRTFQTTLKPPLQTELGDVLGTRVTALGPADRSVSLVSRHHLGLPTGLLSGRAGGYGYTLHGYVSGVADCGPLVFSKLNLYTLMEQ